MRIGEESLQAYSWSSYPDYLKPPRKRSPLVEVVRVLGGLELADDTSGRTRYKAYMERRAAEEVDRKGKAALAAEWEPIRHGWYLGSESFGDRMRELVDRSLAGKSRGSFSGPAAVAHDEAMARRLVLEGLRVFELREEDLETLRKLDARKQVLAWWVRKQILATYRWVSEALCMGYEGNISKVVRVVDQGNDRELNRWKRKLMQGAAVPKSED